MPSQEQHTKCKKLAIFMPKAVMTRCGYRDFVALVIIERSDEQKDPPTNQGALVCGHMCWSLYFIYFFFFFGLGDDLL
jgi:hypothetical protein